MSGTVREARLGTPTARRRLKAGRQPHWATLVTSKAHLGWQRWSHDLVGRWLLRLRRDGNYAAIPLGVADDASRADGVGILTYEQARSKGLDLATKGDDDASRGRITVNKAMANYLDYLKAQGKSPVNAESAAVAHILPHLGDCEVAALTSAQLRRWLMRIAETPAQTRPSAAGERKFKPLDGDEAVRKRRSSANRMLAILKAALNHAYDEKMVASNDAWGRRVRAFKGVDVARSRYLTTEEAMRLLNACSLEFRPLVRAALETGCRYGELTRLEVSDFNPDSGTIAVRKSKTNRSRHVILTVEGAEFFANLCAGRAGADLMLSRASGAPWVKSAQSEHMVEACRRAKIEPPISFHGLRHTWASLAVMNGMPLMVVAKNLGHVDTRMVEHTYGHLSNTYVAETVRANAPRFGAAADGRVSPLRHRRSH